ncbi:hypothetical protein EYF80_058539 [Liparis tanakae]|uniref:Uncharacterized protein n=1 Tax=Liparis tanakae TaxID=230148 RepID=A0A4Z2ERV1_9TELE|nr:hypothetical protein EYF80_058539 [Liparis tanakae]
MSPQLLVDVFEFPNIRRRDKIRKYSANTLNLQAHQRQHVHQQDVEDAAGRGPAAERPRRCTHLSWCISMLTRSMKRSGWLGLKRPPEIWSIACFSSGMRLYLVASLCFFQ